MAFPPKDPVAKHLSADHYNWPNVSFLLVRNYLDSLLTTPFFMKSQNITFPVICLNPDFLPEVSDILMRKQEAFVWTKHLRLENAERGRESESNRVRSQSRIRACLSLRDRSEIQTRTCTLRPSPAGIPESPKCQEPKYPARGVNKLRSTHTAACGMGNKNDQRPIKLTFLFFFKGWKKRAGDFVQKREEKRQEGNTFECQESFSSLLE